jgi:hypothetical protein
MAQNKNHRVSFQAGRDGSAMTRVNGKVAFPDRRGPQPQVGETWDVEPCGSNPAGTVIFLRLVRKVDDSVYAAEAAERRAAEEAAQQEAEDYFAAVQAAFVDAGIPLAKLMTARNMGVRFSPLSRIAWFFNLPDPGNLAESLPAYIAEWRQQQEQIAEEDRRFRGGLTRKEVEDLYQKIRDEYGEMIGRDPDQAPRLLEELRQSRPDQAFPTVEAVEAAFREYLDRRSGNPAMRKAIRALNKGVWDADIPIHEVVKGRWQVVPGTYVVGGVPLTFDGDKVRVGGLDTYECLRIERDWDPGDSGCHIKIFLVNEWFESNAAPESPDGYRPAMEHTGWIQHRLGEIWLRVPLPKGYDRPR